ncbi:MAG: glycosyltransferase family 2 protein [Treponema sp.]|jgi:glycosyltransferase involved in cell wall biosynthesis|nr:glycosyltransferase family 2 protein [Treponema sp.]
MKFSLIMATLGRTDEIIILLDSLLSQSYKNFELIIIDQNDDDQVEKVCDQYKDKLNLHYYRCDKKGLSLGRNIGLEHTSGDIIAFPDDDCEYETDTLKKTAEFFEKNPHYSFYTCNTKEKNGNNAALETGKNDCDIGIFNFLSIGISFTIFVRSETFAGFAFDEQLGVGAAFGSAEESDLLLYLIKNKKKGKYHAGHYIYHPGKTEIPQRVYSYSMGFGALFKKALFVYRLYPMFFIFLYRIFRNIVKLSLRPGDKIARALVAGRLSGFLQYKPLAKVKKIENHSY